MNKVCSSSLVQAILYLNQFLQIRTSLSLCLNRSRVHGPLFDFWLRCSVSFRGPFKRKRGTRSSKRCCEWTTTAMITKNDIEGREPWSSGCGRRLVFEGCGFESRHHFSHIFVAKIVMKLFEKTENKKIKRMTLDGQWLWLSWQSRHFRLQRSAVRIQSLPKFYIEHLITVNCRKDENKEKGVGNDPFL